MTTILIHLENTVPTVSAHRTDDDCDYIDIDIDGVNLTIFISSARDFLALLGRAVEECEQQAVEGKA